jgi:hypothetical protein
MAAGQHASSQIAAFLGTGETRLIAAAYKDRARRGELFVLEDDQALELRTWAKQNLRCMFDDCPVPDLTTVSRANKRDGFKHGKGGRKHTPESVNHRQGKAVVANWLREAYPYARVELELATDTQRSNVADVMLILASGQRVAFEVQYAALSVAEWRRRHESYARQSVSGLSPETFAGHPAGRAGTALSIRGHCAQKENLLGSAAWHLPRGWIGRPA